MAIPIAETKVMWGANWYRDDQIVVSMRGRLATIPAAGGTPKISQRRHSRWRGKLPLPARSFRRQDGSVHVVWPGRVAGARIGVASIDGSGKRILNLIGTDPIAVIAGRLIYASADGAIMAVPFDERRHEPTGAPVPVINDAAVGGGGPLKGTASRSGSLVY